MKKFVILILIVFLLSSVAFANDFTGTWIYTREMKNDNFHVELFYFFEDGTGFYYNNSVDNGIIDEPLEMMITWEQIDNGVRIYFNGGYRNYSLIDDGRLSDGESFAPSLFVKVYSERWI